MIEIDWPKNNDAVPVRVSKHDAKSLFRFCDMITKDDAALYYENKKLVQGSVHVLSFWVREFPFKSNDPFKEGLRCDLVFNPHPGGKQEEALLVLERLKNFSCIVNVVSDIPTAPQGGDGFMLITNHLCSFDKLPLFISGGGFLRVGAKRTILLDNSVRQITDKEMRKSAKRFASLLIRSEGGHLVGPVTIGRTFYRTERVSKRTFGLF